MSEVKRPDEWREYVRPCSANGVEHDCTHDYISGWPVESFQWWFAQVKAAERAKVLAIVRERHDELAQCHKQDDCHLLAKGIGLAMDDVNERLGAVDV